ncbi:GNAT family N-acetyltransferase [Shewanella maritima]|uniref:GNAT family N-acetyltransferase n=2 Tax=Shewanella TaxID=22 RepID=UPI001F5FA318|nr:GNAT family N-acetyltransferase [Shewanella maritima]
MLQFIKYQNHHHDSVIELFKHTFSDSEGEAEGKVIGELVNNMLDTTDADELVGALAFEDDALVGAIMLTPMPVSSGHSCYLLSPVAVATSEQGKGVGQQLINWGKQQLVERNVD